MLQLLQPAWMFAAAGIVVPLLIHLWNVKRKKALKIGSIALLTETPSRHARTVQLSEWWLLLLRCLLILLLALLLSGPQWITAGSGRTGWVLMDKQDLRQTYAHFKPQVDSLLQAGWDFHFLNGNLESASLPAALADTAAAPAAQPTRYWQQLRRLDYRVKGRLPVYLFTGNGQVHFTGARPALAMPLYWRTYTTPLPATTFIQQAYQVSADSFGIVAGRTDSTGTVLETFFIHKKDTAGGFRILQQQGQWLAAYLNNAPVPIDTAVLHITLYTGGHEADARYVQAAIGAIRQASRRRITVTAVADPARLPQAVPWLCWLSDAAIPAGTTAGHILQYAAGKAQNTHALLLGSGPALPGNALYLYRYVPAARMQDSLLLQDAAGHPILAYEQQRKTYHVYTRFNPDWNNLVWSEAFPVLLYRVLYGNDSRSNPTADQRVLAQEQLLPTVAPQQAGSPAAAPATRKDIQGLVWLLALVLLAAERFFSFYVKK